MYCAAVGVVAKHVHVTGCSIFSVVQYFWPDYGLLLELHTLTLAACSYVLLLWHLRNCYCILFWPCFFSSLLCSTIDDSERACDSLWTAPWLADHLRNLHLFFFYTINWCVTTWCHGYVLWVYPLVLDWIQIPLGLRSQKPSHKLVEAGHQDSSSAAGGKGSFLTKREKYSNRGCCCSSCGWLGRGSSQDFTLWRDSASPTVSEIHPFYSVVIFYAT